MGMVRAANKNGGKTRKGSCGITNRHLPGISAAWHLSCYHQTVERSIHGYL